jgi:hypothetical protein
LLTSSGLVFSSSFIVNLFFITLLSYSIFSILPLSSFLVIVFFLSFLFPYVHLLLVLHWFSLFLCSIECICLISLTSSISSPLLSFRLIHSSLFLCPSYYSCT